ncbi:HTH-type transcriptional repressor CytR [Tritonibacter multivorans]|uniref:HTH-type transcriptional repressor CytR n=1 Tax=Tritonibacter multivorans TaxID=928856 RepID=A0A0P1G7Y5_9RHOB|nr:LacI family DNA-binding transcriptional regulator [Tritonibacter multivorans]MDA7422270.1 LacI family DNA-binding transcriptional regulator [Tritonibacter multivorans]CUH77783.1 HTH-type transcriptional repressor CytR [Tritonibacter multivorans]SFD11724.1 LacI family transcriptional regulator [Tritonibacter multivorans]
MAKATMKDVATLANVSVATVDRVLHEREGVSSRARQRVKEAIHELGFRQLPARLSRKVRGRIKLLFLLPQLTTGFVTQMIEDLKQAHDAVPDVEVMVEIKRIPLISGTEIIEALSKVKARDYQGVGLFAVDAPGVRSAIDDCMARGVPVVTLVSDVPSSRRVSFVGIDNMAAGRTAGRLMGKFLRGVSGEIAIITGNMQIRDHVERQMGFRQVLGAEHRDLRILSAVEGNSIAAKNHSITIDLLRDQKRVVGIYAISSGSSGIFAALREMRPVPRPVVIAHELSLATRHALEDGCLDAVIGQDVGHIARSAVRKLTASAFGDPFNDAQENIGIDVFLRDNLP